MKKIKYILLAVMITTCGCMFFACKKKLDSPPVKSLASGASLTISQLKTLCTANGGVKKFNGDTVLYATVTADETSGNIYKVIYLRDINGDAISMHLTSSGGLYVGDSIRINLNKSFGCSIDMSNSSFQIDSVTVNTQIAKMDVGKNPQPKVITISQLTPAMDGQLVRLDNVEFASADIGQPYADAINHVTTKGIHYIHDCSFSSTAEIFGSGYSNFASQIIPAKNGSITAVAQLYGTTMELIIRKFSEVNLSNPLCNTTLDTLHQTFSTVSNNTTFTIPGWVNYNIVGPYPWQGNTSGPGSVSNPCAGASGPYSTSCSCNTQPEIAWLITPPVSNSATKYLSFRSASKYNGAGNVQLYVYASTDYNGTTAGINSATWKPLNCGSQIAVNSSFFTSGNIPLNAPSGLNGNTNVLNNYSGNFYIGFKFVSNTSDSTAAYYIDDVIINN